MHQQNNNLLSGDILEEQHSISLSTLCHCCSLPAEAIILMVDQGIVEPLESSVHSTYWQFSGDCIIRIQTANRIQQDLGVNLAGAALALELLDEIKQLREQVNYLLREGDVNS